MSNWKEWDAEQPPVNELVLVSFGYYLGLRMRNADGDLYDENNDFDDSENEPVTWHPIPS